MVTLAVDTSQAVGSVALARDGELLGVERFHEPSSHLVALGRAVDHLLAAQRLAPADVDRLAVVVGPGSFTGLRIGLSFVKGFHAARGTDVVAIDSLRLLALPLLPRHPRVCAMIDARRAEVYAAVFKRASAAESANDPSAARVRVAPCARTPADLFASLSDPPDAFTGSGAAAHRAEIAEKFPRAVVSDADAGAPSTPFLATIAHRMRALHPARIRDLEPAYIRPSGAERVRLRAHARHAAAPTRGDRPSPSREREHD